MKILPSDAGTWLDGSMGWHNIYRVVDLARDYGFQLTEEEFRILKFFRGLKSLTAVSLNKWKENWDLVEEMDQISTKAYEHLNSLAPDGFQFEWDGYELFLVPIDEE